MASPKKTLVLDLGMQSLRIAEFSSTESGGLKLLRGARRELMLDPALDTSRPDQIRLALKDILKAWRITRSDVVCVLPAHTVFTRVVPLEVPGGSSSQVAAVVGFEAQQNIPFPLEEVVWDYVVMGNTPSGAVNVIFAAIKTDLLESLCDSVASTGLNITAVLVAPLALYDAFLHASSATASETTLLLDMGSRTSNMIISAEGSFFSRSIPSGGLAVTSAIAKDIHAELDEAEKLKIARGSVALGAGFEQATDPIEANIARIARQTLLKTQADISRSLSYYRSNLGGNEPTLILLTGGMAYLPYLAEFFNEKLQKKTSFFNPMEDIGVAESAHSFLESNSNNLGELVGGALVLTSSPRTKINLLPPSVSKKRSFAKRIPYLAAAVLFFLASLGALYGFALQATSLTRATTATIDKQIADQTSISNRIKTKVENELAIQQTTDILLSLVSLWEAYPRILTELSTKVPERYLWITEIQPAVDTSARGVSPNSNDGSIKALLVKGLYLDNPKQASVIDDFVTSLQSSDVFAVEEKEKSKIITQRGSPNGEYWAYPFSLRIPLRNPFTPLP
ncbi:MAG: pilus assembly protein PilM [Chthoniobacterales bacterium]|nr:pilus assembly protein PilM [Chthoniobacterales bacterium]